MRIVRMANFQQRASRLGLKLNRPLRMNSEQVLQKAPDQLNDLMVMFTTVLDMP